MHSWLCNQSHKKYCETDSLRNAFGRTVLKKHFLEIAPSSSIASVVKKRAEKHKYWNDRQNKTRTWQFSKIDPGTYYQESGL